MGESKKVNQEVKKSVWLIALAYISLAIVIIYIIFINVPDALLYAKKGALRWLPYVLIFGALPYSGFKTMQLFYPKYCYIITVGLLLVIGPLFGLQLNRFDHLALGRDGEIVSGTVTRKYEFKPSNRDPEWLIQASFSVKNQKFETFPQVDKHNKYSEGDNLDIIYSKQNPEINMLYFQFAE